MKKHILSKKCWCKPDVISFRKENEDNLSDKILKIAALFNDSMDNDKYNRIRKILESFQMEIEVETGLKNFQVTTKELADARKEVISKVENLPQYWDLDGDRLCVKRSDVLATLKEEQI